ncbi:histidine kinase N-terminal 7TM domain-containing protein [Haloarchaeobius sp. HME9146]|uniref:histidine kinase N-terminal 7TM domain-containing protein n=1 Tax=Haloarchaeobius sp. HME9146 TaxID=2978732 RepID=UPI0021C17468|nr:histidine kinase N-terminal 7TM domain-containing protein [Haloarchaeobius sp. HME9146]MCT9097909.1 PAS domain-containing protein [Haloarchaeobius sp. HME9146]
MVTELHPYTLALIVAVVVSATVSVRAWQYRPAAGATPLAVLMVGVTEWLVFHALEVTATSPARKLLWADLQWLGAVTIPLAWLAFALEFTGRDDERTERLLRVLLLEPLLGMLLLVTNNAHELLWGEPRVETVTLPGMAPMTVATAHPHVGAIAHALFSYVLLLAGTVLLVQLLLQTRSLYRIQGFFALIGVGLPWVANVLALLEVTLLDLTPLAFTVTGVAFTVGLYRYRLLDLVPVAYDRVVSTLDDGVLVIDQAGRVVDTNAAADDLFETGGTTLIGQHVRDVVDESERLLPPYDGVDDRTEEVSFDVDGEPRYFSVQQSELVGGHGQVVGIIAVFHDITRQKEREQELQRANAELERTNDRLDEFASVVSHDLRNPLTVAQGWLEMARETGAPEDFEAIVESHERMEHIIDDLLTLAREGADPDAFEAVALPSVARDAWAVVDTGESTLAVETDLVVTADRQRLKQLFENLYRNAVEHNDGPVDVRVGTLSRPLSDGDGLAPSADRSTGEESSPSAPDQPGFYVEDDGRGIPESERKTVFESGYSGSASSTGIGLAIVAKVADAHDWTVTVTERCDRDDGTADPARPGARFEFRRR